jgi:ribosomal protein L37E
MGNHLSQCKKCGINTYQENSQCVICKLGLRKLRDDLISLLIKDKNFILPEILKMQ